MAVVFENSFYKQAYQLTRSFDQNRFKQQPQFSYEGPSYDEYSRVYEDSFWEQHKFRAIPAALWSGIVKVIYDLSQALLLGFPSMIGNRGLYFKAQLFSAVRDIEEAFGHLLSLFDGRLGLFYIQRAEFHKSCYSCFYDQGDEEVAPQPPTELHSHFRLPRNPEELEVFRRELSERSDREISRMQNESAREYELHFRKQLESTVDSLRKVQQSGQENADMKKRLIKMWHSSFSSSYRWCQSKGWLSKEKALEIMGPYLEEFPEFRNLLKE